METKITQKDLIGDLENFPIEVVEKMIEKQYKQTGERNITLFQEYRCSDTQRGGFSWHDTIEGRDFWENVIRYKKFDVFFERYPKLSKKVYIRGDDKNGKNVIKELESRGGINKWDMIGNQKHILYFIDPITNYIVKVNEDLEIPLQNLLKTVYTEISPGEDAMVELTIEEIAEKLGVDVNKLRIKK